MFYRGTPCRGKTQSRMPGIGKKSITPPSSGARLFNPASGSCGKSHSNEKMKSVTHLLDEYKFLTILRSVPYRFRDISGPSSCRSTRTVWMAPPRWVPPPRHHGTTTSTPRELVAFDDKWRATVPASGREFGIDGMSGLRIKDGRIVEVTGHEDTIGKFQLGCSSSLALCRVR